MPKFSGFRWPRLTSMPLALEITLVLALKVAIVLLLRQAFFSQPQAKKMLVPALQIEQHFFSGEANVGSQSAGRAHLQTGTGERHDAD